MAASLMLTVSVLSLALAESARGQGAEPVEPGRAPSGRGRMVELPSRGGIKVVSLGSGRGRLRLALDPLEPVSVGDDGKITLGGGETFLLSWLRRMLPDGFPGIDQVDVIEQIRARRLDGGRGAMRTRTLEVSGTEAAVRSAVPWLHDMLAQRRTGLTATVHVFAERYVERVPAEAEVLVLDETAFSARLAALRSDRRCRPIAELEMTTTSGRDVSVSDLEPERYLEDYDTERLPGRTVVIPRLGTVFDGVQATFAGLLQPDGRTLALSLEVGVGVLKRPIREIEIDVPGGARKLQLPEVDVVRWSSDRLTLAADDVGFIVEGLVLPGSARPEGGRLRRMVLLVRVAVASPPPRSLFGHTLGYDDRLRVAFVRTEPTTDTQPGHKLVFSRHGKAVGRGEVLEVLGDVVTVAVREGVVRRGDEVR